MLSVPFPLHTYIHTCTHTYQEPETEGGKDDHLDDRDVFTPGNINTKSASADEDNHRVPEVTDCATDCVADCTNKTTTDASLEETEKVSGNEATTCADSTSLKSPDDYSVEETGPNADVDSIVLGSDCNIAENNSIFDNNVVIM